MKERRISVSVLFVCMGNICRSPAGEGVFRHYIEDAGHAESIRVDSAGTIGYHTGNPADSRMQAAAARRGYSLESLARQVTADDLRDFDLVIAMDVENLENLDYLAGDRLPHVRMLGSFLQGVDDPVKGPSVPDPYYGGGAGFETVLDMIEAACPAILEHCLTLLKKAGLMRLRARLEKVIGELTGEKAQILETRAVAGGSINHCSLVELKDGRTFFLKTHPRAGDYPGMFAMEFRGLQLAVPGVLRVPSPLAYADDFILMEAIVPGVRKRVAGIDGQPAGGIARATRNSRYGFDQNNYLGTSQQVNSWHDSWLEFWRQNRLGFQLDLFARQTDSGDRLLRLGHRLMEQLDGFLAGVDEDAVLLHGDLWSGNAAADEAGEPVIFDPASYYGHREAEIGMMRMFGGFGPRCEAAYNEVWPLENDAERRIDLYRLYHELNHLNLFGRAYYDGCLSTLKSLL